MAFGKAPGYENLPLGNFSPVIYSKKVQIAFRKKSITMDITNSDYFGEIANQGDTVKILKEPEITVNPYLRGTQIATQDLMDDDYQLVVDKANYFAFKLDDIEEVEANVNWISLATNRAAYRLADQLDQEVLGYLSGYAQSAISTNADEVNTTVSGTKSNDAAGSNELLANMQLNATDFGNITTDHTGTPSPSIPVAARLPGAITLPSEYASPVMVINRMSRLLDQQNVDKEGRWCVIDPVMLEVLMDEDSRFLQADWGETGALRNGLVLHKWNGFRVYVSNNLPILGTGPATPSTASQDTNFGVIVAGQDSAVASAEQINKTETYRDPDSFADVVRGMQMYGRKILRPEAIVTAKYNLA